MIMNKAFERAKRNDEEKVGLNIKIPISMKNEFDELCKQNGVSMTATMLSLIEITIEESKGNYDDSVETKHLVNKRIVELEEEILSINIKGVKDELEHVYLDKREDELKRLKKIFN